MSEINAGTTGPAVPSLARLIALARLSECVGRLDSRHVLLERMLGQLLLFTRMAERLNLAAPETAMMRALYREVELGCLECKARARCRAWLDGRAPDDDYHEFCPNEGLFDVLPRQSNVTRPYGPA